ncbi:YjbH domain-containing protein, partial [Bacteroides fragilis]|nr:YjbH domain-containing protein [Bacteroides fragilis]
KDKYTLQDGIFGGLSYTPSFCKPLSIMAEYDSDGFNVGAAAKLWKHLSLNVFTREFKCISGGIRYECVLIH